MKFFDYEIVLDYVRRHLFAKVLRDQDIRIITYLERKGVKCLHCGSDELDVPDNHPRPLDEGNPDTYLLKVRCVNCGNAWTDVLLLVNVQDYELYEGMKDG